jgi:hypothetical protein
MAKRRITMKTIKTPALTLLAALLLTGCSGSHWALPDPGTRRAPRLLRTTTPSPSQLISTDHQAPPDVPTPAGLPVVLAAWWWSRRLRHSSTAVLLINETHCSASGQPL